MNQNHRSSIFEQQNNISSHCNGSILEQLNPNTTNNFPFILPTSMKRQSYLQKKVLYNKIQKGQLDHCCIDIVNRKNNSMLIDTKSKNTEPSSNPSNIQMLKKEIQYLEEDNLKWQKFPKSQLALGNSQPIGSANKKKPLILHLQSLQKISQNSQSNGLLKNFYNTFNNNFFISPIPLKASTSSQKKTRSYFGIDKIKSIKNCMTIESIATNKQNILSKTIHSTAFYERTTRRKYLLVTRKNSTCAQNSSRLLAKRKKISAPAPFVIQTL